MYKRIKVIPKNNPNKKLKVQFSEPVLIISSHYGDDDFYDHPDFDKENYEHWFYEGYRNLKRSYGRKRSSPGAKSNLCQRQGHVIDYPEYRFSRNMPYKEVYDVTDSKSCAYKLADNWKGNSKRKKQWYR